MKLFNKKSSKPFKVETAYQAQRRLRREKEKQKKAQEEARKANSLVSSDLTGVAESSALKAVADMNAERSAKKQAAISASKVNYR